MAGQRDRIVRGLAHIVDGLDRPESVLPLVRQLGREHRKHGLDPSRFACLTEALALAVEEANGEDWTRDLAESWCTALDLITTAMSEAAEADEEPWAILVPPAPPSHIGERGVGRGERASQPATSQRGAPAERAPRGREPSDREPNG